MRELIQLRSTAGTGYFYVTRKKKTASGKLELKKFDPKARRHVIFKEAKLSSGKKK